MGGHYSNQRVGYRRVCGPAEGTTQVILFKLTQQALQGPMEPAGGGRGVLMQMVMCKQGCIPVGCILPTH